MTSNNDADLESLQIDENLFLEGTQKFDNFLNHCCEPNAFIDWDSMNLVALRDIKKGEEITYNYCTSEYDMGFTESNFICNCNSNKCYQKINGFRHLSLEQKMKLKDFLSPFLRRKLEEELKNAEGGI